MSRAWRIDGATRCFAAGLPEIRVLCRFAHGAAALGGGRHGRRAGHGAAAIGDLAVVSGMHGLHGIDHPLAFADAGKPDLRLHLARLPSDADGGVRRGGGAGPRDRRWRRTRANISSSSTAPCRPRTAASIRPSPGSPTCKCWRTRSRTRSPWWRSAPAPVSAAFPRRSPIPPARWPSRNSSGGKPVINIPGCPPIPEAMTGALSYVLSFGKLPELDHLGRPKAFFGETIHDRCYRRPFYERGLFADGFDDEGARKGWCLYKLGCKGPTTYNACATLKWNGGVSFPIQSGHGCLGCSEPDFWDRGGFYRPLPTPLGAMGPALAGAAVAGAALGVGAALPARQHQKAYLAASEKREGMSHGSSRFARGPALDRRHGDFRRSACSGGWSACWRCRLARPFAGARGRVAEMVARAPGDFRQDAAAQDFYERRHVHDRERLCVPHRSGDLRVRLRAAYPVPQKPVRLVLAGPAQRLVYVVGAHDRWLAARGPGLSPDQSGAAADLARQ